MQLEDTCEELGGKPESILRALAMILNESVESIMEVS